jgi:VCBS repeat-containing protein
VSVLSGTSGSDTLAGTADSDAISGGAGSDTIVGGGGSDVLDGGAGNDQITAGDGNDTISGGAGDDTIGAGDGSNLISGGAGNDVIGSGDGMDQIDGGAGDDQINAGDGDNVVDGGAGNDTIVTGSGIDIIEGGAGSDLIDSGGGTDLVRAGAGDDTVVYFRTAGSISYALFDGEAGKDKLRLVVSRSEYDSNTSLRAEILAYQQFLAGNAAQKTSFTFTFGDGVPRLTLSAFEKLEIVFAQNTAPVAVADFGSTGENETKNFDVIANDTDADPGDVRTLTSLGPVAVSSANASVAGLDATGAFSISSNQVSFAPGTLFDALAVGETATVTLVYTMRDLAGAISSSVLTLTIIGTNDAPVVEGAVTASIVEDDDATLVDLLANAHDVDLATDLDVTGLDCIVTAGSWAQPVAYVVDPQAGTLSIDPVQFQGLADGDVIELTFSYSIIDGNGGNTPASAVVTVTGRGDAPVIAAGGDAGNAVEDDAPVATGTLAAADVDLGDSATWTAGAATYGTADIDPTTGEWTYTLDNSLAAVQGLGAGDILTDSFVVTVTDSDNLTDTRTVTLTITGTGDAPVIAAGGNTGEVVEDDGVLATGTLLATDADLDETLTWTAGLASYGIADIDPTTGEWTYTLDNSLAAVQGLGAGDILTDSFIVTVTDSDNLTDTQTVNIVITGTADGHPTAVADTIFTNSAVGTTLTIQNFWLVRNDTDPTNDLLNVGSAVDGNNVDQVTAGTTQTSIRVNVAAGATGDFSYTAVDAGGLASAPVAVAVSRSSADSMIVGSAGNDTVIDGRTDVPITTLDGASGSDIVIGGAGSNAIVADQADLLIDGGGGSDTLQVTASFDDASDGQLANIEAVTLSSGAFANLAQQTEAFLITGSTGGESIVGGSGNDTIVGAIGADSLNGGAGADVFVFNATGGSSTDSADVPQTGSDRGQDTVVAFDLSADTIRVVATNVARFSHGAQTAVGTGGSAADGSAAGFALSTGLITINNDTNFTGPADIVINFAGLSATLTEASFEARLQYKLTGDSSVNLLVGGALNDTLNGGASFDTLQGGGGDDILIGGEGEDDLTGGAGADQFRLHIATTNADAIFDYQDNIDKIAFRGGAVTGGSVFANTTGSIAGTTLSAADFVVRSSIGAMQEGDDNRVVVINFAFTSSAPSFQSAGNNATNTYVLAFRDDSNRAEIWFDTNWNNETGRVLMGSIENINTLDQLMALTNTDFLVYANGIDPIILDLDGNGLSFTTLDEGRSFDIDGDGTIDRVAWNSSADGMLAVDFNGNGTIDDGTELFTPGFGGGSFATGGDALASLDSNGDGQIDANDDTFGDLLLWRDADADGISDAGEVLALSDYDISSLLVPTSPGDGTIDGQEVVGSGTFIRSNGSVGTYVEVALGTQFGTPADMLL